MLQQLSISNYTIIRQLDIRFEEGFSVITGETGAGKSILLDALTLVLGQRADTSVLRDKTKKSVIEAVFLIDNYNLESFFSDNDIDYDNSCLIRREITPQGKSRAFINDTPVSLHILQQLTDYLVDIHSQHGNLLLQDKQFQLHMIDQSAHIQTDLKEYKNHYRKFLQLQKDMRQLQENSHLQDMDYLEYLYHELQEAHLQSGEQKQLEESLETLNHAAEIKMNLFNAYQSLSGSDDNLISHLKEVDYNVQHALKYQKELIEIQQRLAGAIIELEDIADELNREQEKKEFTQEEIARMQERLDVLYNLQQKHRVNNETALIEKEREIGEKIESADKAVEEEKKLRREIEALEQFLQQKAQNLHEKRQAVIPMICKTLEEQLKHMNMPHAKIEVQLQKTGLNPNGFDEAEIRFSANAGIELQPISKIASGGEMSRVMLAIKTLIAEKNVLPTIIFDEIESGVSGEVSSRMAEIMKGISRYSQIIAISHQAQIASKADHHFLVYKETRDGQTFSDIRKLNPKENILEIAKMLSDGRATPSSIKMAETLINQ